MANPMKKTTQKPRKDQKKRLIRDQLMNEITQAIPVMMDKRDEATYRQLAMSIESFIDTVNLLDGMPKGIHDVAPALNDVLYLIHKLGWNRVKYFNDMRDELRLELARQRLRDTQKHEIANKSSSDLTGDRTQLDASRSPEADRAAQGSSAAGDAT